MKIRLFGTVNDSIVDGPGMRLSVFTQGCRHDCPGCHNPDSHSFDGGTLTDVDEIIRKMDENPLLDGITLTGGDPMEQPEACTVLAEAAHKRHLNVWVYTGYTYEDLIKMNDPDKLALLRATDVLVDGPFILKLRSLELKFCGSSNQRLIDVPATLSGGQIVLWKDPWDF